MDIEARIKRRQRRDGQPRLIRDYESLSPVAHVDEPSDRGPVLERLLDHLDPVFDGSLPPNAYLYGPAGAGKSAVVTALFAELERLCGDRGSVIHTSTRAATRAAPRFVYVDGRSTASEFEFYHAVLDALVEGTVPEHGISTDELRDRLHDVLGASPGAVVAVDHVDGPGTAGADELIDRFASLPSNVSWLAVGRADPDDVALTRYTASAVQVDPYRRQALVDLLMARMSAGLARRAVDHALARRVAEWADGNAHDALAVVFVAADRADRAGRSALGDDDVAEAIEEVPEPCVSLGRVFALPDNRLVVLRKLVDLDADDRASVTATTEAVSSDPDVDLSPGTVKRFLYEMAEIGVVERVQSEEWDGRGRPPSRVELRFPPTAFRRLYDLQQ
ncbi:Cdc6/Cdc18 family protein [Halomicrobium urmianum]|uniref:Cdc6/Cdc18 family protein n=1 Tax=Halomicrobium urmianum TaxID=1586233 RepID=UPI001CD9E4CF|nr:AAA family ATPase [Halomicrobium urmianum]